MTKAFAALPTGAAARGTHEHQIIEIVHRAPTSPAVAGALILISFGAVLLAAAELRRPAPSKAALLVEAVARAHGYPPNPQWCRAHLRRVK